jgi:hypothetical protein
MVLDTAADTRPKRIRIGPIASKRSTRLYAALPSGAPRSCARAAWLRYEPPEGAPRAGSTPLPPKSISQIRLGQSLSALDGRLSLFFGLGQTRPQRNHNAWQCLLPSAGHRLTSMGVLVVRPADTTRRWRSRSMPHPTGAGTKGTVIRPWRRHDRR